jgi:hypothetical protein
MTEKWQGVPGMASVRVARIEDADPSPSADRSGLRGASHSLLKLVIDPGSEIKPLGDVRAVNLHMQDGHLRVSISEGEASVVVASGEPIRSGDDDIVFCDRGRRHLDVGESAILGAGNNFTIRDGVMHMEVVGDTPAELQMSIVKKGDDDGDTDGPVTMNLCWLCPFA